MGDHLFRLGSLFLHAQTSCPDLQFLGQIAQGGKLIIQSSQLFVEDILIVAALLFQSPDTQDQPVQNVRTLAA